jgi:hypothetical protein
MLVQPAQSESHQWGTHHLAVAPALLVLALALVLTLVLALELSWELVRALMRGVMWALVFALGLPVMSKRSSQPQSQSEASTQKTVGPIHLPPQSIGDAHHTQSSTLRGSSGFEPEMPNRRV